MDESRSCFESPALQNKQCRVRTLPIMPPVIDLTIDDSSDASVENLKNSKLTKVSDSAFENPAQRLPFQTMSNNGKPLQKVRKKLPSGLVEAIDTSSLVRLRFLLKDVCRESINSKAIVQSRLMVASEIVIPYYADTESEQDADSLLPSTDESESESDEESLSENTSGHDGQLSESNTELVEKNSLGAKLLSATGSSHGQKRKATETIGDPTLCSIRRM